MPDLVTLDNFSRNSLILGQCIFGGGWEEQGEW